MLSLRRFTNLLAPIPPRCTLPRSKSCAWQPQSGRNFTAPVLAKMHVPDSFGGRSPESKAADALQNLFTYCAAQAILYQLGGGGEGGDVPPTLAYQELEQFLQDHPIKDGDAWLAQLLSQNQMLGVRVMEVRQAYCAEDFDWEGVRELANRRIKDANVKLMRQFATERFGGALGLSSPQSDKGQQPPDDGDMSCYI